MVLMRPQPQRLQRTWEASLSVEDRLRLLDGMVELARCLGRLPDLRERTREGALRAEVGRPSELLRRLAAALEGAGWAYAVTGGQAALVWGRPRTTLDIDITVLAGPADVKALLDVLARADIMPLPDDPAAFAQAHYVVPCADVRSGLRVDVTLGVTAYEAEAVGRALPVTVEGQAVRYLSPEDLVVHKLVAGRPQDVADVVEVLRAQPTLDLALVRRCLRLFETGKGRSLTRRLRYLLRQAGGGEEAGERL